MHEQCRLSNTKPLRGHKILVTRARDQASHFSLLLRSLGAEPIEFPTIEILPPPSWEPLDRCIAALSTYQWLIFTSVNGVKYFLERLGSQGKDVRALQSLRICAIGPATAAALEAQELYVDILPQEYRAEAIVAALQHQDLHQARILIPRALEARAVLIDALREAGATVDVVPAYQSVKPAHSPTKIKQMLRVGEISVVTFTSSSTVKNFVAMFEEENLRELLQEVLIASIGPITADTARELGIESTIVPAEYTIPALAQAIVEHITDQKDSQQDT